MLSYGATLWKHITNKSNQIIDKTARGKWKDWAEKILKNMTEALCKSICFSSEFIERIRYPISPFRSLISFCKIQESKKLLLAYWERIKYTWSNFRNKLQSESVISTRNTLKSRWLLQHTYGGNVKLTLSAKLQSINMNYVKASPHCRCEYLHRDMKLKWLLFFLIKIFPDTNLCCNCSKSQHAQS